MAPWKSSTAFALIIALCGCQATTKTNFMGRAMMQKTITRLPNGGVSIEMKGDFFLNPTAAVETFHLFAEKQLGRQPYRYSYTLKRTSTGAAKPKPAPETPASKKAPNFDYIPIYTGGQPMSGEGAIVLGSLALLVLLAEMGKDNVATEWVPDISGTAIPIAPAVLDHSRPVEVIVPDTPPALGRLPAPGKQRLAEAVRAAFAARGFSAIATPSASHHDGYAAKATVLRAQGNFIEYSNLTVEVAIEDQRTGRELTRLLVQASEKPFDLKTQSERQKNGIATSILTQPLADKLATYVR